MIKQMNLKLETYGISNFLFYKVPSDTEVDTNQLELLLNHKVPHLLPTVVLMKDEEIYVRYDQISDITLNQTFKGKVTKQLLMKNLLGLIDSIQVLNQSGINLSHLLLHKDYIFLDLFSKKFVFIYVPVLHTNLEKINIREFFRDLISTIFYDEKEDLHFFIKLHNYLAEQRELNLTEFKNLLTEVRYPEEEKEKVVSTSVKVENKSNQAKGNFYSPGTTNEEASAGLAEEVITSEYHSQKKDKKTSQKLEIEEEVQYKRITRTEMGDKESLMKEVGSLNGNPFNILPNLGMNNSTYEPDEEEGTTVLGAYVEDEEGTTTLGVDSRSKSMPFLLGDNGKEIVLIDKDHLLIGRDPSQSDYALNSKVVGRVHAEIITLNGEYFVIDKESKNGTFLNGVRILPKMKTKIKHEDQIKFANLEFVFRLF